MEVKYSPSLPAKFMEQQRRKRVCEKRSNHFKNNETSATKKKRISEPRPHPPDCLNKRYWDDVRAGRIPEPTWTAPNSTNKSKETYKLLETKAPSCSDNYDSKIQRKINSRPSCSIISPFNAEFLSTPFPYTPMPILPFFNNPMLNIPPPLPSPLPNFSCFPPPQIPISKATSNLFPKNTSPISKPSVAKHLSSDEQVDKIVNDHFLSKHTQPPPSSSKNISNLCIIPFPVPIPIILPLTSDFIYKNFGNNVLRKK